MQAVLILAHGDIDHLYRLCQKMQEKFQVYVHIDKKSSLWVNGEYHKLDELDVEYFSEVEVNWGSWSIGEAMYRLLKRALQNPDINYFHIISGQDWPIKSIDEIYDFYDNNDNIYMYYGKANEIVRSGESVLNWQKFYYNYDVIKRRTLFGKIYHRFIYHIQRILRIDKLKKYNIDYEIYIGSNWADLPRDSVEYAIQELENNENFRKVLETGCFSDEFWLPTVLCNSEEFKSQIDKNTHRFIKWEKRNGSFPAALDERDIDEIIQSDCYFARKVVSGVSDKLVEKLACTIGQKYCEEDEI